MARVQKRVRIACGWSDEIRWAKVTRPPNNSEGFATPERQYRVRSGPSKVEIRREADLLVAAFKAEQARLIEARKLAAKPKHVALAIPH